MGKSLPRPKPTEQSDPRQVRLLARSGPTGHEVLVRHLGPVLATSRSFDCDARDEAKEACRKEALRAAQAKCVLLGGNCILAAKATVTPALVGAASRAKDSYVVSGNACILKAEAYSAKAVVETGISDGRTRQVPATKKLQQETQDRGLAARVAGELLLVNVLANTDANWFFG
jgi:hypothetical protein